jgi:hypothetical protein
MNAVLTPVMPSLPYSADSAARNVTLEVVAKPPGEGAAAPPLQQQLAGLFAGLQKDAPPA